MSLPTLLKTNSIIPKKWMTNEQKNKLATIKAIDWIIEYLTDRSWDKKTPPKVKIKGPGSRVGVFRSGTGTGKSTIFPPAIYHMFFEDRGIKKNIICTQPTIATATDIPFQIINFNPDLIIGKNIGYQTGSLVRKPVKGILFATIGILLQHLKLLTDEEFMRKYSFIILDEIHLRSVETDTTLFYLRRFLERNYEHPDCPYVILTSGTFDPDPLMDYFNCPKDSFLDIVGSSFPIQDNYSEFDVSDCISYTVDLIEKIHINNPNDITTNSIFRDILVFVQGGGQIKEIVNRIHRLNTDVFSKGLEYAKQHSELQQKKYVKGGKQEPKEVYYICPVAVTSENMQKGEQEYQNTFSPIESVTLPIYEFDDTGEPTDKILQTVHASRRVIVATNAIETGLTIDTLKYCIDTGFVNESQFNPNFGVMALLNKSVTQASALQRRGRVGRKDSGLFYTCYTKKTYDALPPLPLPDIIKADVTMAVLDAILNETETKLTEVALNDLPKDADDKTLIPVNSFQMNQFDQRWYRITQTKPFNLSNLIFLQSPAADSFKFALERLRVLGFIDHNYSATILGWFASKFRKISIENARMILAGYHHGANILDLITITCFLQAGGFKLGIKRNKYKPRNPLDVADNETDLYYQIMISDEFIEYLFIWDDFVDFLEDIDLKSNHTTILDKIHEWAEENQFNPDALLSIVTARDELITDLLNIGMDPFYNGYGASRGKYNLSRILNDNLSEGMEEIRKLKNCILEGYRLNIYVWNEPIKAYVSPISYNSVVLDSKIIKPITSVDPEIQQIRPQKIIVHQVMLRPSSTNKGMYEFVGSDISVLDGFVDPDLEFH